MTGSTELSVYSSLLRPSGGRQRCKHGRQSHTSLLIRYAPGGAGDLWLVPALRGSYSRRGGAPMEGDQCGGEEGSRNLLQQGPSGRWALEAVEASCSPSGRHGGDSKKRRALILDRISCSLLVMMLQNYEEHSRWPRFWLSRPVGGQTRSRR